MLVPNNSHFYANHILKLIVDLVVKCLKGLFTNFKSITFFCVSTEKNIFYERSISIEQL